MLSKTAFVALLTTPIQVYALNAPMADLSAPRCYQTGQNSVGIRFASDKSKWELPLAEYCKANTWDIILMSFNHIRSNEFGLPGFNFAYHCTNATEKNVLDCPQIAADIKICQENGVKLLLSVGGATGLYDMQNESEGIEYADKIWKMVLGGSDPNLPRPFGSSVLDGVDLDIETGKSTGWSSFAKRLRELYETDASRTYYLSAAPQCPFPDASLGPKEGTALQDVHMDFLFVQFYNNYCKYESGSQFNFATWDSYGRANQTLIFMGVPGAPYAAPAGGYNTPDTLITALNNLIDIHGPESGGSFGGMSTWDVGSASDTKTADGSSSLIEAVYNLLQSRSAAGVCRADNVVDAKPQDPPKSIEIPTASSNIEPTPVTSVSVDTTYPATKSSFTFGRVGMC